MRSARTSTGRCFRAMRGSRTGSSSAPSSIAPASGRCWNRWPTISKTRRSAWRSGVPAPAAAGTSYSVHARARGPPLTTRHFRSYLRNSGVSVPEVRRMKPPGGSERPSGHPERPQVHHGIPGAPAGQEALDRRVEHDLVQLPRVEEPVTAHGRVLRRDRLQGSPLEVAREDDVDDVLRGDAVSRRDRVDDRDRTLDGNLVVQPDLFGQLPVQRADEALTRVHPTAGEQPVRAAVLLVPAEQDPSAPAQDRGHPDPRLGAHHASARLEEPKPRTPRSVGGSSSTSAVSTAANGTTTSWAIRIPGSTTNGAAALVLSRITRTSPR